MSDLSEVCEFYKGKNIFLTGGTGFVGICLIEKILRSIPESGKIYMLMRPKRGKEIADRLSEISANKIFAKLLETASPDVFQKLIPIAGEIGEEGLALSPEDRKTLIDNVDVVIHSAATLDFQQNLKPTVTINLLGTRRVLQLCHEMKKLKVMVHISSAYVNAFELSVTEIQYPAPADAEKVIELATTLSDSALEELEPSLLKNHPNTYTFTKHLAEHEVVKYSQHFPCAVVRPSMITAAWKEPVPGWTNSKNGPQGFLMGASRGVIRRLPMAEELIYDYIPVDTVINLVLVAGMDTARKGPSIHTYHCTSSTVNPFRWQKITGEINDMLRKYPLKSAVWYPHLKFSPSIARFKISAFFVHMIPAFFLDIVSRISGQRPILMKMHRNVNASLDRLERFIFTEWKFDNSNTMALSGKLTKTDKAMFPIDISSLDWKSYFTTLQLGVREYLNNESTRTLPAARSKNRTLMIVHIIFRALIVYSLWYMISCLFGMPLQQCAWVIPIFYIGINLL